jgi:hypothetical protein
MILQSRIAVGRRIILKADADSSAVFSTHTTGTIFSVVILPVENVEDRNDQSLLVQTKWLRCEHKKDALCGIRRNRRLLDIAALVYNESESHHDLLHTR